MSLLAAFIVSMAIQYILFIPAFFFKTDKLTDLSYSLTFIILCLFFYVQKPGSILLAAMVCAWAARLMIYLFIRILTIKKDSRFDGVRENFWKFLQFWTFQGVAAYVIFMGGFLFFLQGTAYWIGGALVFMLGLIIETISDYQKFTFKNNPKNKNKWIESGLWKYMRHPNYTGEMLVWLGIFLYVVPGLTLWYQLLAFISPLTIFILLRFVSGVPTLHKFEDAKWGKNPAFKAYKKRTGLFLPKLW